VAEGIHPRLAGIAAEIDHGEPLGVRTFGGVRFADEAMRGFITAKSREPLGVRIRESGPVRRACRCGETSILSRYLEGSRRGGSSGYPMAIYGFERGISFPDPVRRIFP